MLNIQLLITVVVSKSRLTVISFDTVWVALKSYSRSSEVYHIAIYP